MSYERKARIKEKRWMIINAESVGAAIILVITAFWLVESLRLYSEPVKKEIAIFPLIVSVFCFFFAGLWLVKALRAPEISDFRQPSRLSTAALTTIVGYALLIPYFGFPLSTFFFLLANIAIFRKYAWWVVIMSSVLISVSFYILFNRLLFIGFPKGAVWYAIM